MWSLKVVKGSELVEKLVIDWPLPQPLRKVTIGRDPACDWMIADRTLAISARHCEIVDGPDGPELSDLSTNGTFVNGATTRLAGRHLLRDGDRLELGPIDVLVSGPPMPPRPAMAFSSASTRSAAQRNLGVQDTAPQRGGDPAAMLAHGGGGEQHGLTEILLAAPPSLDSGLDLTRIREVPASSKASAMAPPAVVAATRPLTVASSPQQAAGQTTTAETTALAQALARGLGVPASVLAGQDLLLLVERLAQAARAAQAVLGPLVSSDESKRS